MKKNSQPFLISGIFTSILLMSACSSPDQSEQNNGSEPKDTSQEVADQTQSTLIQPFPSTPDDAHDIQLLTQYQLNNDENMSQIEADLQQRLKDNNLSDQTRLQLQQDAIQSSLNMLKELDLKTAQGRYIQGLFYQYWDNQQKIKDGKSLNAANLDTNEYFKNAQNQLAFWKTNTSPTKP